MFATEQDIISAALGMSPRSRAVIIESLLVSLDDTEKKEYVRLNKTDRQSIFEIATKFYQPDIYNKPFARTEKQTQVSIAKFKKRMSSKVKKRERDPNKPFLGSLTFEEYYALPNEEQNIAEILQDIADNGGLGVSNPVKWQREIREERQLPFRSD